MARVLQCSQRSLSLDTDPQQVQPEMPKLTASKLPSFLRSCREQNMARYA